MPRVVTGKVKKSCSAITGRELRKTDEGSEATRKRRQSSDLWGDAGGMVRGWLAPCSRRAGAGCAGAVHKKGQMAQAGEVVLE